MRGPRNCNMFAFTIKTQNSTFFFFSSSDVFDGAWGSLASYSSGVDLQLQHLPQRFHSGIYAFYTRYRFL